MKSTGLIRRMDSLGRVVIPMDVRKAYGWDDGTPLEIYTDNGTVKLAKHEPGCHCCGNVNELVEVMGVRLCQGCVSEFGKASALFRVVR